MWQITGQNKIVSLLQRSLEQGSLAHAYLFVGPPHVGKMTLAINLAQAVNCDGAERPCGECVPCRKIASGKHADVQIAGITQQANSDEKSKTEISIDQVRAIQHSSNLPPFEGKYRVYIIDGAEQLSIEAANCLLKTLEEPPERVIFILLTINDRDRLPATVVSRCQRLQLFPLAVAEVVTALVERWGIEQQKAELLARLSHGCLGWAVTAASDATVLEQRRNLITRLLEVVQTGDERFVYAGQLALQFGRNRDSVYHVLSLWLDWWRDALLVKTGNNEAVTNTDFLPTLSEMAQRYSLPQIRSVIGGIQDVEKQLRQNANAQLALEVMMLNIPKREKVGEDLGDKIYEGVRVSGLRGKYS